MSGHCGIVSAVCELPVQTRSIEDVFASEGLSIDSRGAGRLGVERVATCAEETSSELALAAARAALELAGCSADELDVIVDYTVLPHEFLVPAWSMCNKLQAELGAKRATTIGFSGGGSSNVLVALDFASSLIASQDHVDTALLFAADCCLPDNRVLDPDDPVAVLGDGAAAMVLRRAAPGWTVVDTELASDGVLHDVCVIPGGAMAHPDREDLYRLRLDRAAYDGAPRQRRLRELVDAVLERNGLGLDDVACFAYPDLSVEDREGFEQICGVPADRVCGSDLASQGHLLANSLVSSYARAIERKVVGAGEHLLFCSHGMGFLYGATLLRH